MADSPTQRKWQKEHTTMYGIRLQNGLDADIIEHLSKYDSKQGEIKRLIRVALEYERNQTQSK